MIKAIRGATTAEDNTQSSIAQATKELLDEIISKNALDADKILFAVFSCTRDLTAAYPAKTARENGFANVPLMCVQEMEVKNSLERCIRVLLTAETDAPVRHIYLKGAINLRTDLK